MSSPSCLHQVFGVFLLQLVMVDLISASAKPTSSRTPDTLGAASPKVRCCQLGTLWATDYLPMPGLGLQRSSLS